MTRIAVTPVFVQKNSPDTGVSLPVGRYVNPLRYRVTGTSGSIAERSRSDSTSSDTLSADGSGDNKGIAVQSRVVEAVTKLPDLEAEPVRLHSEAPSVRAFVSRAQTQDADAVLFVVYTEASEVAETVQGSFLRGLINALLGIESSSPPRETSPVLTLRLVDVQSGRLIAGATHLGTRDSTFRIRTWKNAIHSALNGVLDEFTTAYESR